MSSKSSAQATPARAVPAYPEMKAWILSGLMAWQRAHARCRKREIMFEIRKFESKPAKESCFCPQAEGLRFFFFFFLFFFFFFFFFFLQGNGRRTLKRSFNGPAAEAGDLLPPWSANRWIVHMPRAKIAADAGGNKLFP